MIHFPTCRTLSTSRTVSLLALLYTHTVNPRPFSSRLAIIFFSSIIFALAGPKLRPYAAHRQTRRFTFIYQVKLINPHPGSDLRLWIPLAHSDAHQRVRIVSVRGAVPLRRFYEPAYGNQVFYLHLAHARRPLYQFRIVYSVTRFEPRGLHGRKIPSAPVQNAPLALGLRPFLLPNRLVPVTGLPARLAARAVHGLPTRLAKAHALYEYVLHHMTYSKTGTGWGHGNALFACTAHHGNCTDFHSLFMAMARSQGIPVRFKIGFPLPRHATRGPIPGYHCWVNFYLPGLGWLPADISQAWLQPRNRRYFFGNIDANRVRFTSGRDLVLRPRQAGRPLNFFVYPYLEVNRRPDPGAVTSRFYFSNH